MGMASSESKQNFNSFKECATLVFFDLETTGIPQFHPPRITELSFCSVERSQFLEGKYKQVPRVTNRLNLCIYPARLVDPVASEKTLLDNYNLEHQSRFDEDVFNIVHGFLSRLKKPVCLIAHNGIKFDFPILKSEIHRLGKELPEDLLCADSLGIFRTLQGNQAFAIDSTFSVSDQCNFMDIDPAAPMTSDPAAPYINPFQLINERTPEKRKSENQQQAMAIDGNQQNRFQQQRNCRKSLPFSTKSPPRFNLESIYRRVYGEEPAVSHNAEADVLTLLLSAIATPTQFLNAVDFSAIPLEMIKKCW